MIFGSVPGIDSGTSADYADSQVLHIFLSHLGVLL